LVKRFQGEDFLEIDQSETTITCGDEMCILYRKPSIDASYQASVHLAKRFQRKRNDQSEKRIACGGYLC
jgi:hypothetical protein